MRATAPVSDFKYVAKNPSLFTEQQLPSNDSTTVSDTSATISTTPVSDTTASDTDPGENLLTTGIPDEVTMDDNGTM